MYRLRRARAEGSVNSSGIVWSLLAGGFVSISTSGWERRGETVERLSNALVAFDDYTE